MPKKVWLFAALGWTLLIVLLCLVSFNKFPSVGVQSADKYVHLVFHFVFTVLWFAYFRLINSDLGILTIISKIVFYSIVFGIVIEIAQELLTANRKADFYDIAANFAGSLLASVAVGLYYRAVKK